MEAAEETLKKQGSSTDDLQSQRMVSLLGQKRKTLEEDEEELINMRAKLFRFSYENGLPKWKERGIGHVKLLKHTVKGTIRLLMRRDKILKICANHHITPSTALKHSAWSKRAWVWHTQADFADETPKSELLAIRYVNADIAQEFKRKFEQCINELREREKRASLGKEESTGEVSQKPDELSVEQDGQREPESHDNVSPKPEELSVKEDSQGELKSHEVSQEPEEHFMEEATQEESEGQEVEATQGEPESPEMEGTKGEHERPEMDANQEEPESPEMEATQEEPQSPEMEPESPEMEATQEEPQSPEMEATQEEPQSPEMEATQEEPESQEMEAAQEEPESPEMEATQEEPQSPEMEPQSPEMEATQEEPKSPEMEAAQEEPEPPEMEEKEGIQEEAEEQQ
ncbi:neurofilament medium polypeptide-like [Trichosurus vulpecula]|uniref:neurofilament medium polypeptide-like n=1 Tax=Trichosurus vulpecula TaxID=9337 RepID=UPI00186B0B66|nr:neurofilament medium polypeptide-like [Trichosurus vulpecula]